MNVLYISVLTEIFWWHCTLAYESFVTSILKKDKVLEISLQIWKDLPNCKISFTYCHIYCIGEEVVRFNGDNRLLGEYNGISFGMKKEFPENFTSQERRDSKDIAYSHCIHVNVPSEEVGERGRRSEVGGSSMKRKGGRGVQRMEIRED